MTITGSGFGFAAADVQFGENVFVSPSDWSDTTIVVTSPSLSPGAYFVDVLISTGVPGFAANPPT